MAEKEVPAGLNDIGRALLSTDRIIVEKARAALSRVLTLVDTTFGLTALIALVAGHTSAIAGLDTRLDTAESDINAAESTITSHTSSIGANASAIAALDTRVGTAESDINALESADTAFDNRIDAAEATIVSHTSSIGTNTSGIAALVVRATALEAGSTPIANILVTTEVGPHTIGPGITEVCQSFAGPMTYVAPAAIAGRKVRIVKDTVNPGQITIQRAGSDTIHGSAANYVLDLSEYVTDPQHFRREWTLSCFVDGEWKVS